MSEKKHKLDRQPKLTENDKKEWEEAIKASASLDEELGAKTAAMYKEIVKNEKDIKDTKRGAWERIKEFFAPKYKYYVITTPEDETLTILFKKENVARALMTLAYQKYQSHFLLWCEHHGFIASKEDRLKIRKEAIDGEAWNAYLEVQNKEITKYLSIFTIKQLAYTKESIGIILRMFNHCVPFGTDEESDFEKLYFDYEEQLASVFKGDLDGDFFEDGGRYATRDTKNKKHVA